MRQDQATEPHITSGPGSGGSSLVKLRTNLPFALGLIMTVITDCCARLTLVVLEPTPKVH